MVTAKHQFTFDTDRYEAIAGIESISDGRGWCNVVPLVVDDMPDMKINFTGLWMSHGVAQASFVTSPPKKGVPQPSSLGVLHSRHRLGRERIALMLAGAPFVVRQDHTQRGLLLEVPVDAPASQILEVMCTLSETLCDFEMTGGWRFDLFQRETSPR
jgi:hypothetical protein